MLNVDEVLKALEFDISLLMDAVNKFHHIAELLIEMRHQNIAEFIGNNYHKTIQYIRYWSKIQTFIVYNTYPWYSQYHAHFLIWIIVCPKVMVVEFFEPVLQRLH